MSVRRALETAAFVAVWVALGFALRLAGALAIICASLVVMHVLLGVPLSLFWRRSGNLLVPATAHALVDAVRNALA